MAPSPLCNIAGIGYYVSSCNIAGIGYYVSSGFQHLRLAPKVGSCDDAIAVRNVDKTPKDSRPLRDPFCRLVLTCGHDERNCEQLNCSLLALSEQIYTDAIGF